MIVLRSFSFFYLFIFFFIDDQIFEAAVYWKNHDVEKRKDFMPKLLKSVRLPLITPQYLADTVAQETDIKNSLDCRLVKVINNFNHFYLPSPEHSSIP